MPDPNINRVPADRALTLTGCEAVARDVEKMRQALKLGTTANDLSVCIHALALSELRRRSKMPIYLISVSESQWAEMTDAPEFF